MPSSITECRDCMEAMKEFPDGFFDLAVCDPPYGIGVQSMTYTKEGAQRKVFGHMAARRRNYKRTEEWDIKPSKEYFDELRRISKKCIIWGGQLLRRYAPAVKKFYRLGQALL